MPRKRGLQNMKFEGNSITSVKRYSHGTRIRGEKKILACNGLRNKAASARRKLRSLRCGRFGHRYRTIMPIYLCAVSNRINIPPRELSSIHQSDERTVRILKFTESLESKATLELLDRATTTAATQLTEQAWKTFPNAARRRVTIDVPVAQRNLLEDNRLTRGNRISPTYRDSRAERKTWTKTYSTECRR